MSNFSVIEKYLNIMIKVLNVIKVPLKIDYKILSKVSPETLSIDKNFQIGGNYFLSIFQTSLLTS